jgi:hypothetical protein
MLVSVIKEDEIGGTCGTHGGGERCLQDFGSEALREETTGRPRRRWEVNTKMDLREIAIDGVNWIRLAQDMVQWRTFVSTVMNHKRFKVQFCIDYF